MIEFIFGAIAVGLIASIFMNDKKQKKVKKIYKDEDFENILNLMLKIKHNSSTGEEWITIQLIEEIHSNYYDLYKEINSKKEKNEKELIFTNLFNEYILINKKELEKTFIFEINKKYIEKELKENEELFSNIDGKSLDNQQRLAAVINDNKMVIAGAGTGKTLTIAGTTKYLVESKKIDPKDILLITFTNKAAKEMRERIVEKLGVNVDVFTFHSLGKTILETVFNKKQTILQDEYLNKFKTYLKEKHPRLLNEILEYFCENNKNSALENLYIKYTENNEYETIQERKNIEEDFKMSSEESKIYKNVYNRLRKLRKNKTMNALLYIDLIEEGYDGKKFNTFKSMVAPEIVRKKLLKEEKELEIKKKNHLTNDEYVELYNRIKEKKEMMQTLQSETVKSYQEIAIANFLFRNCIKYKYEEPYPYDHGSSEFRRYCPDFYLPEYDIYIEHFGINRNGKTPQYTKEEEQMYLEGIKWKRETHKKNNTIMVESYSYDFTENNFPDALIQRLKEHGVKFNPLPANIIAEMSELVEQQLDETRETMGLFMTFLNLFRNNNYKIEKMDEFISKAGNENFRFSKKYYDLNYRKEYDCNRETKFLKIEKELLIAYREFLDEKEMIDFSDMISKAIDNMDKYNKKYKYIVIDEYQDTSRVRCELVQKIKEKNKDCKVMVVGDDWQSIYRFAGNDLDLFIHFDKYLGSGVTLRIENTYRNSQELVDIASKFVMENDNQIKKNLHSNKKLKDNPIKLLSYEQKEPPEKETYYDKDGEVQTREYKTDLRKNFYLILEDIRVKNPNAKNILILGRYKKDAWARLYDEVGMITKEKKKPKDKNEKEKRYIKDYPEFTFTFLTVHSSKGLEADEVILMINDNPKMGFPSKVPDDPILRFVLSKLEEFPNAEERRLFYVATTRTRNRVYVVYNKEQPSSFIEELKKYGNIEIIGKKEEKELEDKDYPF